MTNIEAEASVLFYLSQAAEPYDIFRQLAPTDFTNETYRVFFERMREMTNKGDALKGDVSVSAGIVSLLGSVRRDMVSSQAVKTMKTLTQRRKLSDAAQLIGNLAHSIDLNGEGMISQATALLEAAKDDRIVSTNAVNAESMFTATMSMAMRADKEKEETGITTGIHSLDYFGKFRAGNLIVIGARTAGGKTALAKTMAMGMLASGLSVGYVCKEMTGTEFGTRMLAAQAGVNSRDIEGGRVANIEKLQLAGATLACYKSRFQFSNAKTIYDAMSDARRWLNQYGTKVFFFDYIQQFSVPGANSVRERIMIITETLKFFALENNVTVIAPAQLSRAAVSQVGAPTPPTLAHFKESGSIEEDCDRAYLLWNLRNELGKDSDLGVNIYDQYSNETVNVMEPTENGDNRVGLFCRKYRGGELFQTSFGFNGPTTSFYRAETER